MRFLLVVVAAVAVELAIGVAVGKWLDTEDDDEIYARLIRAGAWQ